MRNFRKSERFSGGKGFMFEWVLFFQNSLLPSMLTILPSMRWWGQKLIKILESYLGLPGGSDCKELPAMQESWVWFLGWEDPLEKGMATQSSILTWRLAWTIWSMGSQRVGHIWVTFTQRDIPVCVVDGRQDTVAVFILAGAGRSWGYHLQEWAH